MDKYLYNDSIKREYGNARNHINTILNNIEDRPFYYDNGVDLLINDLYCFMMETIKALEEEPDIAPDLIKEKYSETIRLLNNNIYR